jgi:UDP-N-acetyl-D-mannosaminuronic acid transferase (WecB/TagA/CpsF family)
MAAQDYEQVTYGAPDGSQVGSSATEKVGFWGATPVVQPTNAAQAALTLNTATSAGYGFVSVTAFNAFTAQLENIRASLVTVGILKGS